MIFIKKIKSIISMMILFALLCSLSFSASANNFIPNTITVRNLAMFASIAYADLENVNNYDLKPDTSIHSLNFNECTMVTDTQLSGLTTSTELLGLNLSGQIEDTYTYLFYNLASTSEVSDWKIVNYSKINSVNAINKSALFSAMTFKRNNDIVISYRGTDFNDLGDWLQDLAYGLSGRCGQEDLAKNYAIKVAEAFPNSNIYVTGHSLGGYLAQIGGAKLLESSYKDNVKEISYFNGMGLYFWSNLRDTLLETKLISQHTYDVLSNPSSPNNKTQASTKSTLEEWYKNGGKLISYHINGDIVSSLGTHCGNSIGFYAADECIEHHHTTDIQFINPTLNRMLTNFKEIKSLITKNSILNFSNLETKCIDVTSKLVSFISNLAFNNNISPYIELYHPTSVIGYVWITHETDSFFRIPSEKLEVNISTPKYIKYNESSSISVTINTGNNVLKSTSLTKSNFSLSNNYRIEILEVSSPTVSKDSYNNNIYTYTLTVQGGILIGCSRISLNADSLSTGSLSNKKIVSNYIRTKLI